MADEVNADDRVAHNSLEQILIFKALADEYIELLSVAGEVNEVKFESDRTSRDRLVIYTRIMLERKFVVSQDKNTYIPNTIDSLDEVLPAKEHAEFLDGLRTQFSQIESGEATRSSGAFNGIELSFTHMREMVAYGRLMHSDRNKFIRSQILNEMSLNLLLRQSKSIESFIRVLNQLIEQQIEKEIIPRVSDSMKETWLDIYKRPGLYAFGK